MTKKVKNTFFITRIILSIILIIQILFTSNYFLMWLCGILTLISIITENLCVLLKVKEDTAARRNAVIAVVCCLLCGIIITVMAANSSKVFF